MSLFQFYSYIDGSLHVSGLQAYLQENSHSCSHNHWFLQCLYRSGCVLCMLWPVLVTVLYRAQSPRPATAYRARSPNGTDTVRTNGCVNSCVNSPEDGPVGPKHVEIRRYMNKIEIVTSVGILFHILDKLLDNSFDRL
jgi:hypothetical protein